MSPSTAILSDSMVYRAGILSASMGAGHGTCSEIPEIVKNSACRSSSILSVSEISATIFLFIISGHTANDSDIIRSAHSILTNMQKRFQAESTICMSSPKTGLNQLASAVCEAIWVSERKSSGRHTSLYFYSSQTAVPQADISDYVALVNGNVDRLTAALADIHASPEDIQAQLEGLFLDFRRRNLTDQNIRQICCDTLICSSSKLLSLVKDNSAIRDNVKEEFFHGPLLAAANVSDIQQIFTDKLLRIHEIFCTANNTDAIVEALDYLLRTQCAKVTLQYVAEYLGISTSYLSFMFKKKTQINFRDYVHQYKMKQAADYLLNTQLLVQQIALLLGYNDVVNFSRVFKKFYGISPSEYRMEAMPLAKEA